VPGAKKSASYFAVCDGEPLGAGVRIVHEVLCVFDALMKFAGVVG